MPVRPDGRAFSGAIDPQGLATLVDRLKPLSPCPVVLEVSDDYENVVVAVPAEGGLPVAIVNPRQVCNFARAIDRLARIDAIAAAVITHFALAMRPRV